MEKAVETNSKLDTKCDSKSSDKALQDSLEASDDVVSGKHSPRVASPGVAKRIVSQLQKSDENINDLSDAAKKTEDSVIHDLTQRFADNLLENPSKSVPKTEYVSINQKLEEKRKRDIAEHLARNEMHAPQGQSTENIPTVHKSSSYSQLSSESMCNGVTSSNDALSGHADSSMVIPVSQLMDVSSLNISKPALTASSPLNATTLWENSNGVAAQDTGKSNESDELDLLTAMSGEPAPNTLPVLADGLSEGEISSESEAEDDGEMLKVLSERDDATEIITDENTDSFFAQHKAIMKNKTPQEIAAVRATVLDIQQAVKSGSRLTHPASSEDPLSMFNSQPETESTSPIWEIRESYAEALRQQEAKRKKRMELERRCEREYRNRHLLEKKMEADGHRGPTAQTLDDGNIEALNTDYSSDEDDILDSELSSWGPSAKYPRVNDSSGSSSYMSASHSAMQASNASRIADHQLSTSPVNTRRQALRRDIWHSNSSYSSSSHSSMAPTVRCNVHGSTSPGHNDSSSSNSWDDVDEEPPSPLLSGRKTKHGQGDYDTDEETDRLLNKPYQGEGHVELPADTQELGNQAMKNKAKEVTVYDPDEPTVLIEGILFRAAYLGSTQIMSDSQPSRAIRMMQAQEAVGRIKAADGESQPSTDVDLFVSTEKVMVLNTDLQEIMMDHALRSISYIADIDNILVIMAKRSLVVSSSSSGDEQPSPTSTNTQHKLICHIFETDEAQLIAQSIGQAFQVAYMEFLKANGIDDPNLHMKDASYEDILEQQEVMNDELETFTRKDKQKDVIVPKAKGEALGIVIVESGWGSVLPTAVLANMSPIGAAARCGQLNIGDQLMSVNGISLVGLPLSTCQEHVKAVKNLTAVRLCIVSRPPVVDVLIKRPDRKYQLGFSVQNGVICSLLRGGIAERGGIRVGHRIIEINGQSVVAVAHEKIVHMLSTSTGEIHMKTMPMAVFRLLTGQEVPQYI
ncbi:uncharacterized protein [Watersipora subatra]|uniref:uncharacterized protein isoform X2 n=1 Tax=Watersipora subatra TaxID=2589382 RepID=UPI00355C1698